MQKSDFTLFFSMPLDEQDWKNLIASHITRVMLPLDLADVATLDRLHSMGIRVVLRVGEDRYYDDGAPGRILNQVHACQSHVSVAAVIVGCEPEHGVNLHYDAPPGPDGWGQSHAYEHRRRFDAVRVPLQAAGFTVVSPGWSYDDDDISEDGKSAPGGTTWREIVTLPQELTPQAYPVSSTSLGYSDANYNGFHMYQFYYNGPNDDVNDFRVRWGLKLAQKDWHKPIWIDEFNINRAPSPLEAMRACIKMAAFLVEHPVGERVVAFTTFVSNGNGVGWPVGYLMRDPQCYVELGQWMTS